MEALGVVIVLILLFGVAAVAMLVVGAVKAGKAVATKVERHEANARRAVENATLRARTFTRPGTQGQLASVRLSLRTSLDATRQVLEAGRAQDGQLAESLQLLDRLDAHAAELDRELRTLEREPDAGRLAAKLPELRERAGRITHSAETMRWAAQDRMRRFADDELMRLSKECENEAGALRHWDRVDRAATAAEEGTGGPGGPGAGPGTAEPGEAGRAGADRQAIAGGRRLSAEDVLGLADPLARLADRLRKPNTGGSSAG
ncbi:hypothetical protein [Kitasatospora sp. NPDC059571]|uniref:hypothetical protein n=1 Tax=Kitasatospora sp. NPDC059571 TaxID=3346871 RepID=UPI00367D8FEE